MNLKRISAGCMVSALLVSAVAGMTACGNDSKEPSTEKEQEKEQGKEQEKEQSSEKEKEPEVLEFETLADADYTVDLDQHFASSIQAKVSVHDPSVVKGEDGKYYIFGSHMAAAVSDDLRVWNYITNEENAGANGYVAWNPVFTDLSNTSSHAFDFTGSSTSVVKNEGNGYSVWAPDVVYNKKMGKYVMYYCTTSNFNTSTICFGVSDTIDGGYVWQKNLVYSGLNGSNYKKTNVLDYVDEEYVVNNYFGNGGYDFKKYPNAIDPSIFYDGDGRMWMVYGSWSGGIFILEVDEETGDVIRPEADPDNEVDPYYGKRILCGYHKSCEAPYILYDQEAGYYYLYVSYGALTADGGYQIRVYRSENPDGPYEDMNGDRSCMTSTQKHETYGLKLSGNYRLPSLSNAYKATGHNSAFIDDDGKRYIVYHTRFENRAEYHEPRVKQYLLNEEGWPCMLPYITKGETVSETGYDKSEIVGRYYVVDQGTSINGLIAEPFILYLTEDGKVYGDGLFGTWEAKEGTPYVHIKYGKEGKPVVEYSGVFSQQEDEALSKVITFSVVASNPSVWGVKYLEE